MPLDYLPDVLKGSAQYSALLRVEKNSLLGKEAAAMPRSGVGVELEAVDVGGSLGCYIFDMDETLARYHCTEVYQVIAVFSGGRRW